MSTIRREDVEICNQAHQMYAEGCCSEQPTEQEIITFLNEEGYDAQGIDIFFDGMQSIWRWAADIKNNNQ